MTLGTWRQNSWIKGDYGRPQLAVTVDRHGGRGRVVFAVSPIDVAP